MNTAVYVFLFIAVFPTLWLLAMYLDRVLPSDVNRLIRKSRERNEDQEQKVLMKDLRAELTGAPAKLAANTRYLIKP
jgi:hypothetical protein